MAVARIAERIGQPLMPWQRLVADVGGELLEDGTPAYREVVFTVPRQNGKTTLVLSWELQRGSGWQRLGPQRIAYTAQTGQDARKKLVEDQFPVLERHARVLGLRKPFHRTPGIVGVSWLNGSRLIEVASTEDAGHGQTIDLAVKDELFADSDHRRDQALRPAMITRPFAQVLSCSTMGTEESIPWNRLVVQGRKAADAGVREGIAYFEWSAPDDADIDDPDTWWRCMPALGHTVTEKNIQGERERIPENEFRRAYLNQQTKSEVRVIPLSAWRAVCADDVVPATPSVLGLDATPERSAGAIAAATAGEGRVAAALVDHRPGMGWLVDRAVELISSGRASAVAVDQSGPAGSLIPELERRGVRVVACMAREMVAASGGFYDAVMEDRISVRSDDQMDRAVAAAVKLSSGDAWRWGRKSAQADVSPLVAVTLANWLAGQGPAAAGPLFAYT